MYMWPSHNSPFHIWSEGGGARWNLVVDHTTRARMHCGPALQRVACGSRWVGLDSHASLLCVWVFQMPFQKCLKRVIKITSFRRVRCVGGSFMPPLALQGPAIVIATLTAFHIKNIHYCCCPLHYSFHQLTMRMEKKHCLLIPMTLEFPYFAAAATPWRRWHQQVKSTAFLPTVFHFSLEMVAGFPMVSTPETSREKSSISEQVIMEGQLERQGSVGNLNLVRQVF